MSKMNELTVTEALEYVRHGVRLNIRFAWILGIIINVYLFAMALIKTKYGADLSISLEIVLLMLWLSISISGGLVNGLCIYKICYKCPNLFYKEKIALDKIEQRNPFKNIRAIIDLFIIYFSSFRLKELFVYSCIGSFVVMIMLLSGQLRFSPIFLTGWLIGIDIFWNILKKDKD